MKRHKSNNKQQEASNNKRRARVCTCKKGLQQNSSKEGAGKVNKEKKRKRLESKNKQQERSTYNRDKQQELLEPAHLSMTAVRGEQS